MNLNGTKWSFDTSTMPSFLDPGSSLAVIPNTTNTMIAKVNDIPIKLFGANGYGGYQIDDISYMPMDGSETMIYDSSEGWLYDTVIITFADDIDTNGRFFPDKSGFEDWLQIYATQLPPDLPQYTVEGNDLRDIADAIRSKIGTSASMAFPSGFTSAINGMNTITPEMIASVKAQKHIYEDITTAEAFQKAINLPDLYDCKTYSSSIRYTSYSNTYLTSRTSSFINIFVSCSTAPFIKTFSSAIDIVNVLQSISHYTLRCWKFNFGTTSIRLYSSYYTVNYGVLEPCVYGNNSFNWARNIDNTKIEINGSTLNGFDQYSRGWKDMPLSTVKFNDNINAICSYAFTDCSELKNLENSNNFSYCSIVGECAFLSCFNLTSVNFPACTSIYSNAFANCSSLATISFPSCTTIGESAFSGCKALTAASFPVCTSIGNYAFANCSSLTTINFPSCASIGSSAFAGCSTLTIANFPACVSVNSYAFSGCKALTAASFPVCTTISGGAFSSCSALTTISFPSCTAVGFNAFENCSSLTTISFPSCTTMGQSAFAGCSALTAASFPVCKTIGYGAFTGCSSLTTVSFPACTSIFSSAFTNCKSLTTASFPVCTYIYSYAFEKCSALTTVSFPVCTNIYGYAFSGCSALTTASFPACSYIGSSAFISCRALSSLYLMGSSYVKLASANVFSYTPFSDSSYLGVYGSIYVPASMLNTYKTSSYWSVYSNRLVGI